MGLAVTEVAFEGFRLMRSRPAALVGWAIYNVVAWAPVLVLVVLAMGPAIAAAFVQSATDPGASNPFPFEAVWGGFFAAILVMVVGGLVINAVQTAAIYRSVLRPQEKGWAYLRLGGDEMRQVLLTLAYALLGMLTFGTGVFLLIALARAAGDAAGVLIAVVGGLALFCLAVFLAVRLSLAAAMTFAERRLTLFGSWGVTRGHFWPLVGMYLVVVVISVVVSLVGSAVAQGFMGLGLQDFIQGWAVGASGQPGAPPPDLSAAGPLLAISILGYAIVTLAMNVVQLAVGLAPQAAAYRALTGPPVETTSEIFS